MFYTCLEVTCNPEFVEILIAEMAEAGFDSFLETEHGLEAYVESDRFDPVRLAEIKEKYSQVEPLEFTQRRVEKKNWNEEWEKNLAPIVVEGQCLIRAEFHVPDKPYRYEIIITPKMSFGTGHHQTTYLMIKNQMTTDHVGKRVMDAGCGTAILSIMASKLGAAEVDAFDIDEWSLVNGKENVGQNACTNIVIRQGTIGSLLFGGEFDLVLANINKNVLLGELHEYSRVLRRGGRLMLSGFYTRDVDDLNAEAVRHQLVEVQRDERENWALLLLQKE
jgi:ribosomal protein L11 methyltransferase